MRGFFSGLGRQTNVPDPRTQVPDSKPRYRDVIFECATPLRCLPMVIHS